MDPFLHRFRSSSSFGPERYADRHRFEHWYRDRTAYFITARCRDRYAAFQSERAKEIFWDRFGHWTNVANFQPWIVSLIDNHYHVIGYCEVGENLGTMMQRIHGSLAKLVNDILPERRVPFFRGPGDHDYFDGCLRDETQLRRAYRYVQLQSVRHRLFGDWRDYRHTRVWLTLEESLAFAAEHDALMKGVRYKRYEG